MFVLLAKGFDGKAGWDVANISGGKLHVKIFKGPDINGGQKV